MYLINTDVLEGKVEDSDPDDRDAEGEGEHHQNYAHLQFPRERQVDEQRCTSSLVNFIVFYMYNSFESVLVCIYLHIYVQLSFFTFICPA